MCGICGFTRTNPSEKPDVSVDQMLETIRHRGPDNMGSYDDENISLGHARLSIIDLSAEANQPFRLQERYILVYNGETYNFKELRNELEGLGHHFTTNSDTEVVLTGYIHFGTDFFVKMNGMFAMAIYDRLTAKLLLVRDRFGIKPLYYSVHNESLIFASEIKAIQVFTGKTLVNTDALGEFLYFGNALKTQTLHKGIEEVAPAHYIEYNITDQSFKTSHYWRIEEVSVAKSKKPEVAKIELRSLLEESVKRHLVSDVPVGIFLSGGIDSSLIAHFASKNSDKAITAYTASFEYDKGVDEVSVAKRLTKDLNIAHEEIYISTSDLPDVIEKLVDHHDSPFSDAANIPLYLMTQQVGKQHKVILQGDGGDEFFAGYRRYQLLTKYGDGKKNFLLRMLSPLLALHPVYRERLDRVLHIMSLTDDGEKMARLLTAERPSYAPENILSARWQKRQQSAAPFTAYKEMAQRFSGLDPVQKMLFTDTQIILPNIFLEKVDRSTMANSVEVRVPLLDNELTSYALGLESSLKMLNGKQKGLLLASIDDILPEYITKRKKLGFSVPFENWLKKPLKEMFFDYLNSSAVTNLGLLDQQEVEKCYKLHESGKSDKGFLLWKVLNLNIWLHKNRMSL